VQAETPTTDSPPPPAAPAEPSSGAPPRGPWRARLATLLQSLALLAAIIVFLALVNQHYPIHRWLFWHYLGVSVLSASWAAACASVGCFLAARFEIADCTSPSDLVLAFPLGVLAFELLIYMLGLAGLLNAVTFCLLPLLLLFSGVGRLRDIVAGWRRMPPARNLRELVVIVFGALAVGLLYFQILSPTVFSWDARWYHLPIAQQYALEGKIRGFPEGWWLAAYPHGASYIYTWAFLLPVDSLFDKLELCVHLELAVFLATIASIPALVRLFLPGASARMAWAAVFLFPGIFLYDGNLHAGADHMAALWCIPLALALVRLWSTWSVRDGVLLGAFTAAILLSKYSAWGILFFAGGLVVVRTVWLSIRRLRGGQVKVLPAFVAAGATSLVLSAPHWLKNWICYGDPLFPILYKSLHVHPWSSESPASFRLFVSFTFPPAPGWQGVKDALLNTITWSFKPNNWWAFHRDVPIFGSLFTLTTLCLPFVRANVRLWLTYLGIMVSMVAWYLMNHQDRYLQAWLPIMAGATMATLMLLWRQGKPIVRALVVVLVAAQIVWGGDVPFFPTHNLANDSPIRIQSNFLASGFQKTAHRFRIFGPVGEVGESLPKDAVVLVHEIQLQMGLDVRTVQDQWQGRICYRDLKTPRAIYDALKSLDVTHVLWETDNPYGWNSLSSDLAFYNFALNHVAEPTSNEKFTFGRLPGSAPAAGMNEKVAVLSCRGPYAQGFYELGDLVVPDPGKPWAQPRATITDVDKAVDEAGFLVVDPNCHPKLPDAVERLYRKPFPRDSHKLYVRKAP
jgi:hypothetical protein